MSTMYFLHLRMNFKEHVTSYNIGSSSEGMEITSSDSSLEENDEEIRSCKDHPWES